MLKVLFVLSFKYWLLYFLYFSMLWFFSEWSSVSLYIFLYFESSMGNMSWILNLQRKQTRFNKLFEYFCLKWKGICKSFSFSGYSLYKAKATCFPLANYDREDKGYRYATPDDWFVECKNNPLFYHASENQFCRCFKRSDKDRGCETIETSLKSGAVYQITGIYLLPYYLI